jgi:formylglycine-generating enzyme required for sulfatase activity
MSVSFAEFGDSSMKISRYCGLFAVALAATSACHFSAVPARSQSPAPDLSQLKTKVNPKDGLTYVWIEAGTFQMGCSPTDKNVTGLGGGTVVCVDSEKPVHTVTISKGFWIGQTQVPQSAYMKLTGSNPSHFRGDTLPVDGVSFNDAAAYCARVDTRLPTEAEYEYAARAGTTSPLYAPLKQIAWFNAGGDPRGGTTHPVATKQPNAFGLYDMIGNVWEWVSDWYGAYDAASAVDPKGPANGKFHVVRGGSWDETSDTMRVEFRNKVMPGISDDYNGFRCVTN